MKSFLLALASCASLLMAGCASDLTPDDPDKPPGGYSPDPMRHIPQMRENPDDMRI